MEKTALYIPTNDWNKIIDGLIADAWEVLKEYDGMDKGIDYNMIELTKDGKNVLFTWDNWNEGEIKTDDQTMTWITEKFGMKFRYKNSGESKQDNRDNAEHTE